MTVRLREGSAAGGWPSLVLEDARALVEVVPARGGLVTRWRVDGREALYLDEATLAEPGKNVRGGIPLLFPNPGPLAGWPHGALPQHGLARRAAFEVVSAVADEQQGCVELGWASAASACADYPFDVRARWRVSLQAGRLLLEWRLTNEGAAPLPWHFGLHPYFRVDDKAAARVATGARRAFDNVRKQEVVAAPPRFDGPEVDLHLLDHGVETATLVGGAAGDVTLRWTPPLATLVLWTLPDKPFVCVEPWTGPVGALVDRPLRLAPGASAALAVELEVAEKL